MRVFLNSEVEQWREFLEYFSQNHGYKHWGRDYQSPKLDQTLAGFEKFLLLLDNVASFNNSTKQGHQRTASPPPTSSSVEGKLILTLFADGDRQRSVSAFLAFLADEHRMPGSDEEVFLVGKRLLAAARAIDCLAPLNISSQKLASEVKQAKVKNTDIANEHQTAIDLNKVHEETLSQSRDAYAEEMRRKLELAERQIERYREDYKNRVVEGKWRVGRFLAALRSEQRQVFSERADKIDSQDEQYTLLRDRLSKHLQYQRPVELWSERAEIHKTNYQRAYLMFWVFILGTVAFSAAIVFGFGDAVAEAFQREICETEGEKTCSIVFSPKGPLVVSAILLTSSILLWLVKLQSKMYLSESHLFLDASERTAFAETFLALSSDDKVNDQNEAIVLGSLFRPTQDGIVKDDGGGMDISAAALLAKQFNRP